MLIQKSKNSCCGLVVFTILVVILGVVEGMDPDCYDELGCFPMDYPWTTATRPLPPPMNPDLVGVKLYLYTKSQSIGINLWPKIDLSGADFNPTREKTVFITHGYLNNGNYTWLLDMKNAYLSKVDANVFLVDWGKSALRDNYLQAASNTRIVGAEIGRFVKYLIEKLKLDPASLHLIGHSLGSHISSYAAKNIFSASLSKPGRITALDPAQPAFEGEAKEVRLDKSDATFVDVIHSDAKPFIPLLGYGMMSPLGHVDFYLNDGTNQPGCYTNVTHELAHVQSISDLAPVPIGLLAQVIACNHCRAFEVFIASILAQTPCLWGSKITETETTAKLLSQGAMSLLIDPYVNDISKCTQDTCTYVGLLTPQLRARGIFTVPTTGTAPYCVPDKGRDATLLGMLTENLISTLTSSVSDVSTGISNILG